MLFSSNYFQVYGDSLVRIFVVPKKIKVGRISNGTQQKTKAHITPPPRWDSVPKLNVWVSTQEQSLWYSQNLCRTLL